MNESEFRFFLQRKKRKAAAIEQIIEITSQYQSFFQNHYPGKTIEQSTPESVESYVSWYESETGGSASEPLWSLRYFFDFIENQELSDLAGDLRGERVKRKPYYFRNFRGVNSSYITKLEALYLENIDQLVDAARTPKLREELSAQTGIPPDGILELVKLCDLARIGTVRSVRARLYHDAGLTPEIIADWEPDELHAMLVKWIKQNNFDGIPPTSKEIENLINDAQSLPKIVIY